MLLVGTYPIHKAGMTMAESMVDHEKACQAMLSFYETHSCTDTASISNFMPAAKTLENLDVKTARWPGDPKGLDVNNTYQFIEFPPWKRRSTRNSSGIRRDSGSASICPEPSGCLSRWPKWISTN